MKLAIVVMMLAGAVLAQSAAKASGPTVPVMKDVNAEVLRLVIEDQWDRGNDMFGARAIEPKLSGETVAIRDERRERAIRQIIADGKLNSSHDYFFSALILQHSPKSDGALLAHVLAITSVSKGYASAKWMAAASLDRYLWSLNQPQIYGTQFKKSPDGEWTMEPYVRETITDRERALWCVVPAVQQDKILARLRQGGALESTGVKDCK